jgi:ATP-binding cassette subfamily B protein
MAGSHHTDRTSSAHWLRALFGRQKFWWLLVLVFNFVSLGLALIQPFPMKLLADSVFGTQQALWPFGSITDKHVLLFIAAAATFLIVVITGLYSLLTGLVQQRIEMRLNLSIQSQLLEAILATPTRHRSRLSDGEYQYHLSSLVYTVSDYLYDTLISIVRSVIFVVAMTCVIFVINPWLALITLGVVPLLYLNVQHFSRKFEKQTEELTAQEGAVFDVADSTISHSRLIQENSKEQASITRYLGANRKKNYLSIRYAITTTLFNSLNDTYTSLATALLIFAGGYLVFAHELSFGDLLVFITYMGMLYEPLQELSTAVGNYKQERVQIGMMYKVIESARLLQLTSGTVTQAAGTDISFENVSLSFGDHVVFNDISLQVPAGHKVAVIGSSGQGKSTLLDMLTRLAAPDRGFIRIGGIEVKDWDLRALRGMVAVVDQTPELLNDTVLANIIYSTNHSVDDTILPDAIKAADTANALTFIQKLPDKFDTVIGTDGVNLSGGQAQRICLARALMKNTPILLLDEPTSALDAGSRSVVIKALTSSMQHKTVILATHDYDLLQAVDMIYVLRNGTLQPIAKDQLQDYLQGLRDEAQTAPKIGDLSLQSL